MIYNFTDRVRRVLAQAREEAIRLRHGYMGTEHLLLGLIDETEGISAHIFARFEIDPSEVRDGIERSISRGEQKIALGELPYTRRAKYVLEFAMKEARELEHDYVGTEHLLLGLLREEKGTAAEVLNRLGMTLEAAREATVRLLGGPEVRSRAEAEPSRFKIRIDDTSDLSIYEQIIAQIQEGIATGELNPGDRLPPVRRLADELDIAPGTVARAYSELEQRGGVVTEGARGTRIAERSTPPVTEHERPDTLAGLLRPVAVAAYHLGATAAELRGALDKAMLGIFGDGEDRAA